MTRVTTLFLALFAIAIQAGASKLHFQSGSVTIEDLQRKIFSASQKASDPEVFVAQTQGPLSLQEQSELTAHQIKILRYIPDNGWVLEGRVDTAKKILVGNLLGVASFPTFAKISHDMPTISIFNARQKAKVSVVLWDSAMVADFERQIPEGAQILDQEGRFLELQIDQGQLPSLALMPQVEFIEPQAYITTMMMPLLDGEDIFDSQNTQFPLTGYETGTRLMGFEKVWARGFTGRGQIVGVADTGLDRGQGNLSLDFNTGVTGGLAVGVGAKGWQDPMGHGTHVAGSVAARGGHSNGQIKGGAYGANLYVLGMWSPILNNLSVPPKLARLFEPAMAAGAFVHTNSWGSPQNLGAYNSMSAQADEWMWNNQEFLVLFASGNSGADKNRDGRIDEGSVSSPSTAKNVLTVGASENLVSKGGIQRPLRDLRPAQDNWSAEPIFSSFISDNPNGIAAFSSRGPTRDGRLKPEVVAPGSNVLAAYSQEPGANPLWGSYDAHHVFSGGTSMSTPLVAGAAAVVREKLERLGGVQNPSASLVKALLMLASQDLYPGQYGTGVHRELDPRPDNHQGFGRIQVDQTGTLIVSRSFVESKLAQGETIRLPITLVAGQTLEALIVYTDAPGSPTAAKALVNDLDMSVFQPNGVMHTVSNSQINNFEHIRISASETGVYGLEVLGSRVAMPHPTLGGQPFALVYRIH